MTGSSRPHAIVTGASSGIGEELARQLSAAGYAVTVCARRKEHLDKLAADLGEEHTFAAALDVRDDARRSAVLDEAVARFGPPSLVVNNAGMLALDHTEDIDAATIDAICDVNFRAPLLIQRWALSAMAGRGGTVVNVTSAAAFMWAPFYAYYNATKAGLAAASESVSAEHRRVGHPVHVVTVYPGPVQTAMSKQASDALNLGRFELPGLIGTPATLCRRILAAVRRKKPRVVYPRVYLVPYAWARTINWLAARLGPIPEKRPRV